jgi:uncharacterized protein YjgD (DUF1641 family)
MPHKIEVIPGRMFKVRYRGTLSLAERMGTLKEVMDLADAHPIRKILVNFKESESALNIKEMEEMGEAVAKAYSGWKVACVLDKPADATDRYIKRVAEKHGTEIMFFDSEEAVKEWCAKVPHV